MLEREFRRVPRIMDVTSSGGTVKRYEIHPDPDRLKQFGITLPQLQTALHNTNRTSAATTSIQGHVAMNVRSVGLFGGGQDPVQSGAGHEGPGPGGGRSAGKRPRRPGRSDVPAAARDAAPTAGGRRVGRPARGGERRIREIRKIVITSVNNRAILLERHRRGRPARARRPVGVRGVVVGHQTRLGRVSAEQARGSAHARPASTASRTPRASWSGATKTTRCSASCCCARARTRCRP